MNYLCQCNQCGNLFVDTNPQVGQPELVTPGDLVPLLNHKCRFCLTDGYLVDINSKEEAAKAIWEALRDIPVDEDGFLDAEFYHFEEGTDREEVWSWIEESFDVKVHDLMFPVSKTRTIIIHEKVTVWYRASAEVSQEDYDKYMRMIEKGEAPEVLNSYLPEEDHFEYRAMEDTSHPVLPSENNGHSTLEAYEEGKIRPFWENGNSNHL